jgi:mRNA guanylyltransferase
MLTSYFAKELNAEKTKELLDFVRSTFELDEEITEFIGAHPVGLSHDCIEYLLNEDYLVCEKSDGIRLMMLVYEGFVYFYDRKNKFYQTDLIFNGNGVFLLDGEMYYEKENYIYSMFDCLIYDTKPKIENDLNKRLGCCFEFAKIVKKGYIKRKNDSGLKNFYIIGKEMLKSYGFPAVLNNIPKLLHDNDGLIFTPVNEPYLFYTRSKILKWKPPHLNTMDFLIKKADTPGLFSLHCEVSGFQMEFIDRKKHGNTLILYDYYFSDQSDEENKLDGEIGEFSYDFDKETLDVNDLVIKTGGWVLHRIRTDKDSPNNVKIILTTLNSLADLVKEEDLKMYQNDIMKNYKNRALLNQN